MEITRFELILGPSCHRQTPIGFPQIKQQTLRVYALATAHIHNDCTDETPNKFPRYSISLLHHRRLDRFDARLSHAPFMHR